MLPDWLGDESMPDLALRIAHVDDDDDLRTLVRVVLEASECCAVASFASGLEALDRIPAFAPDVILMDVLMPGMDGLETVRALRSRMSLDNVSVVFATGIDDEVLLQPLRAESDAIIRKPLDALALARQLTQLRHRPDA